MCCPLPCIPSEWRPVTRLAAVTGAKSQTSDSLVKTVLTAANTHVCTIKRSILSHSFPFPSHPSFPTLPPPLCLPHPPPVPSPPLSPHTLLPLPTCQHAGILTILRFQLRLQGVPDCTLWTVGYQMPMWHAWWLLLHGGYYWQTVIIVW